MKDASQESTTTLGESRVAASLRDLLEAIVDFAGLFPPAKLSLDDAMRCFAQDVRSDDAWMLARFVCPSARLPELTPYLETLFDEAFPLHLSVLGRGGDDLAEGLAEDFEAMKLCQSEWSDRVVMDTIETRLPAGLTDRDGLASAIEAAGHGVNRAAFGGLPVYLESDRDENWRAKWTNILGGLASANANRGTLGFGFKLRCGGLVPDTFPSVEQVAGAIWLARNAGVPVKFTAGLHHPVRHYNDGVGAKMHGFLNVFFAGAIAASDGETPEEQIREIIACEDASAFTFGNEDARCGTYVATRASISAARDARVISFGSCSFAEPREDLRKLGLMV